MERAGEWLGFRYITSKVEARNKLLGDRYVQSDAQCARFGSCRSTRMQADA